MANATGALTAPCATRSSLGTCSTSIFAPLAYVTAAPANHTLEPLCAVMKLAVNPPVQLSAKETLSPRKTSNFPSAPASVSCSRPKAYGAHNCSTSCMALSMAASVAASFTARMRALTMEPLAVVPINGLRWRDMRAPRISARKLSP